MGTLVFTHQDFAGHVTPPGHPEQVARLAAVARAIATVELTPLDAPLGDVADVYGGSAGIHLALRLRLLSRAEKQTVMPR